MNAPGFEQLTLSQADSLVSRSPWLESKKGKTTTATYGRSCSELSVNLRRVGLSVRTYLESCELPLPTLCRTWSMQAMTSSCLILKLRLSERSTGGNASHLWPTVTTMDHLPPKSQEALDREATKTRPGRQQPANLRDCVNVAMGGSLWPTPRAQEWKDSIGTIPPSRKADPGKDNLTTRVSRLYATPQNRDFRTGERHRFDDPKRSNNLNDQIGGQLNPTWVEALMGFPRGWTDLED